MPRRYYDYLPQFQPYHVASTIGSWILVIGLTMMFWNLIAGIRRGPKVGMDVWGTGTTLEWKVPSPPPMENFDEIPIITTEAYDYSRYEAATEVK